LNASLATAPRDAELLVDLAALQTEADRLDEARTTLRRAVALAPQRADIAERLAVINHVVALDPTRPRLRVATRANRARLLLAQVLEQTRACAENHDSQVAQAREDAAKRMRRRAPITAESADQEIALAARLWETAPACQGTAPEARAIALILQRIESAAEPLS
jgi:hypothetical protein